MNKRSIFRDLISQILRDVSIIQSNGSFNDIERHRKGEINLSKKDVHLRYASILVMITGYILGIGGVIAIIDSVITHLEYNRGNNSESGEAAKVHITQDEQRSVPQSNKGSELRRHDVAKKSQSVSFISSIPESIRVGGAYTPSAISTSMLPVDINVDVSSLTVCSISSGVVTFLSEGECLLDATQPGDDNYSPAALVKQTMSVGKLAQQLHFTSVPPTNVRAGDTYSARATSDSGLGVTIAIDDASSSVCSIASGIVSFNAEGVCLLNASQDGDAAHNPANIVQQKVQVTPRSIGLDYSAINKNIAEIPIYIEASNSDDLSKMLAKKLFDRMKKDFNVSAAPTKSGIIFNIWAVGGNSPTVSAESGKYDAVTSVCMEAKYIGYDNGLFSIYYVDKESSYGVNADITKSSGREAQHASVLGAIEGLFRIVNEGLPFGRNDNECN